VVGTGLRDPFRTGADVKDLLSIVGVAVRKEAMRRQRCCQWTEPSVGLTDNFKVRNDVQQRITYRSGNQQLAIHKTRLYFPLRIVRLLKIFHIFLKIAI
jgi:hypothetical protein